MRMLRTIMAVIRPGEQSGFVAECVEIPVVTQGATLDETVERLREATELFLEGEVPSLRRNNCIDNCFNEGCIP